jgi:gamma-glutamyltranspeptidase/glutathione hydrolase
MSFFLTLTFSLLPYLPTPVTMVYNAYRCLVGLLTLQLTFSGSVLSAPYPFSSSYQPSLAEGHLGAVASESEICSHIGTALLKQGGNAADALVGTVACVGVVGMYHSGMSRSFLSFSGLLCHSCIDIFHFVVRCVTSYDEITAWKTHSML